VRPVYLPYDSRVCTDKNHKKIWRKIQKKKSYDFLTIFVSVVYIEALNIAAMDAPFIIIFLHYLYKYFSDEGNDIESMHNDKTLDYVFIFD